ncbi:MAG: hypothetical protein ABW007_05865 [Chitinophagaceae bacterium]
MNNSLNKYPVKIGDSSEGLNFYFVSKGKSAVIKVVNCGFVAKIRGEDIYNFGFGDFDMHSHRIVDSVVTENGDAIKVFNTVLSTVPLFFERFPNDKLIVKGSDSRAGFENDCKPTCRKNCKLDQCRKANQRIRIYRNYVDKNFEILNTEYRFFGGYTDFHGNDCEEDYVRGKDYISVSLVKRNV